MAKDKNNKKKNSFIKKAASFALVGAMLAGSGTSNLMAGNDPISVSGDSTSGSINSPLKAKTVEVDVTNVDYSKPVVGIDLGSTRSCVSCLDPKGAK